MIAVHKIDAEPVSPFSEAAMATLNKLRLLMARVNCAADVDAFNACMMLSAHPTTAATAYAEGLLKVLRQAFGHAPRLFAVGSKDISEDEAWLLRVILCAEAGDEDSLRFLTTRRLSKETRRPVLFMLRNLTDRMDHF